MLLSTPLAVLSLLPLSRSPQTPDPSPRDLSPAQALEDLEILREAIEVIHPGLGRYAPAEDFRGAWDALVDATADGTTDLDLYRDVSLLIAGLRCGHSRVDAPEWLDTFREQHPTLLPFHFQLFDDRMFVDVAADAERLPRGTEILEIDGVPVSELLATLAPTVPVDGWTDSIRPSRLQTAYEFQDSGFDHYLPLFEGFRERFELLVRTPGSSKAGEVEVDALGLEAWRALDPDVGGKDFADAVAWHEAAEGVALLEVGTFVNYRRPVDPEATFAKVFREMREAGCDRLVLDLRGCGGGSSDVGWTLARFLIDRPVPVGGQRRVKSIRYGRLVPHLSTWIEGAFEQPRENFLELEDGGFALREPIPAPLEPHPERFRGPITILAGPYNASGSTMLLAVLQAAGTVRIVGEPTGGSAEGPTAGLIFFLTLPNSGVRINVPVIRESSGVETFRPGHGVEPDVLVERTLSDFLEGRDGALETALELQAASEAPR